MYEDRYGNPVKMGDNIQEANKELGKLYNELNLIYFGGELPPNIPVYFNVQLKSTIGRMIYETRTRKVVAIEMSADAFKRAGWKPEMFFDTLIHEMVHAWVEVNKLPKGDDGHGGAWLNKMNMIFGHKPKKEHQYADAKTYKMRYCVKCRCGASERTTALKPKKSDYTGKYASCCGAGYKCTDTDKKQILWNLTGKRAPIRSRRGGRRR